MRVILQSILGDGREIPVTAPNYLIGRSLQCHLRLGCPQVSRLHCELIVRDGYVAVKDLESTNGTFVNGKRVTAEHQLHSGDELGFGLCLFRVILDEARDPTEQLQQAVPERSPAEVAPSSLARGDGLWSLCG